MFPLMNNFIAAILLSATSFTDPATPKALPFNASAFVTINNQIRLAINKETDSPLVIFLRDDHHQVLLRRVVGKKEHAIAMKLIVNDLADGQYELEIKSNEGSIRRQLTLTTEPVKAAARLISME